MLYGRDMPLTLSGAARASVGSIMPAKSLELRHTIRLIRELEAETGGGEDSMEKTGSPITAIPGMGSRMEAIIPARLGCAASPASIPLTRLWPLPAFPRLHTNPGSSTTAAF